jgi:hypothetical protein
MCPQKLSLSLVNRLLKVNNRVPRGLASGTLFEIWPRLPSRVHYQSVITA